MQLHNWLPASATPTLPRGKVSLPRGKDQGKVAAKAMGREANARRKISDPSQRGLHALRRRSSALAVQHTTGPRAARAGPVVGNCPRGRPPQTSTTVPGTGNQQPGCTIFLLCDILWLILRQCCQRLLRPGRRQRKGQGPHEPEGGKAGTHTDYPPRVRPSPRGLPKSVGPIAQRSPRSAPTRSQARLGDSQAAQSGSQGPEMQGSPQAGRRGIA